MNISSIVLFIILGFVISFIIRKYVKLSMVVITTLLLVLFIAVDVGLYAIIFSSKIQDTLPLFIKILLIIISVLPFICISEFISHTFRILDYLINRNKLSKKGSIQKGTITAIKSYGFNRHIQDGSYLIVDFNGEKIKSLPFRYQQEGTMIKTTHKIVYSNGNINKERAEEILGEISQPYNIGDEIDVIVYNNKKYVKLK